MSAAWVWVWRHSNAAVYPASAFETSRPDWLRQSPAESIRDPGATNLRRPLYVNVTLAAADKENFVLTEA